MVGDMAGARRVRFELPGRGGAVAGLEFGPAEEPVRLVFSHANGFNARTYAGVLAGLGVRCLAVDARGHGRTQLPTVAEGRRTWDDMKDDLVALVESLDLRDVVLAGHSMGATVSVLAAAEAGARVRSLLLLEPVIMARDATGEPAESPLVQGTLRRRARFESREAALAGFVGRGPFRAWSEAMLADYLGDGLREADDAVELACAPAWEVSNYLAQAHDVRAALGRVTAPVRILKAETGSTCRLEAAPGHVEITIVPGTTHFLPMERPDVAVEALKAALA
ncbi:alpha/beta fold hydrolase [Phenylobacterium terrae]|uniref:Alpha/beta fold hydrolase n=1 Tax=Phenylobacterium terrae TaxID=2665495 RepID=A0ABW4MWB0_9CAUL